MAAMRRGWECTIIYPGISYHFMTLKTRFTGTVLQTLRIFISRCMFLLSNKIIKFMFRFMFSLNKELYFVPVLMILKCLKDVTDTELYRELMIGANDDPYR